MSTPEYKKFLAGIIMGGATLASCAQGDIPVPSNPPDKGPGEFVMHTRAPGATTKAENPYPGWQEYTSLLKYNRLILNFWLPEKWSFTDGPNAIVAESPIAKGTGQTLKISVLTEMSNLDSDTFAKSLANKRQVEDTSRRSPLKLVVNGKEVLSFVKINETVKYEEIIFGFTLNGVGVAIILDGPTDRIDELKTFVDTLNPVSVK